MSRPAGIFGSFYRALIVVASPVCFSTAASSSASSAHSKSSYRRNDFRYTLLPFARVAHNDVNTVASNGFPIYRASEVAKHTTMESGIWVIFEDGVYDITKFVQNHPGGADKIMLAAGKSVEPFWRIYRQHYNSKLPLEMLTLMRVGTLHPEDVVAQNEMKDSSDPYFEDPPLSPVLTVHSSTPANAEAPPSLLAHSYITPTDIFFVRNHHPVPKIENAAEHQISIDVDTKKEDTYLFKCSDLKKIYKKKEGKQQ